MDAPSTRCSVCRSEFADSELVGAIGCPQCGTQTVPMRIRDDVTVEINWHELRCLTMWASNWCAAHFPATDSAKALATMLHRLALQHPELAVTQPLTMAGEVELLRAAIEDGEIPADGLKTNIRDILDDGAQA